MQAVIPESYHKEQAYNNKINAIIADKKKKFEARVSSNIQKEQVRIKKHLSQYNEIERGVKERTMAAEQNNSFFVPKEAEFFVAIRIRGMNRVPPTERKTLDLLRLRSPNACVFIRNNKPLKQMLQKVRNYIAYGTISIEMMRELIYKRGYTKVDDKEVNITNELIEDHFNGEFMCLEDIIHCIYTGGKYFKKANNFLQPFRLSCPRKGFKGRKARDFIMGGSCGNHYNMIEDLLKRMI